MRLEFEDILLLWVLYASGEGQTGTEQQADALPGALPFSPFPQLESMRFCKGITLKHLITYKDLEGCLSPSFS